MGDMACHVMDASYTVLKLGSPTSIIATAGAIVQAPPAGQGVASAASLLAHAPPSALTGSPTLVQQATTARLHRGFELLRASFVRLGVSVVCADSGDPVRLILDRLDRLRIIGTGGRR